MKKLFSVKVIASLMLITLLFFIIVELLSRICPAHFVVPSCLQLSQKYKEQAPQTFNEFLPPQRQGSSIEQAVWESVIYVDREDLLGVNGIACGYYAYVANDLPHKAKRYVSIHEVIHLQGESNETKTNLRAGALEPLGLIETVFYSIYIRFKNSSPQQYPCVLGNAWSTFKRYFLNLSKKPDSSIIIYPL